MWRNPQFLSEGGTVSIIAHSLGSVMIYDILREKCDLDPEISTARQCAASMLSARRDPAVNLSGDVGTHGGVGYSVKLDSSMEDVDGGGTQCMCRSMCIVECLFVHTS